MVKAAWGKFSAWFMATVWPLVRSVSVEWWDDLGDKPRSHFLSMVFGMFLYFAIKLAVKIAA